MIGEMRVDMKYRIRRKGTRTAGWNGQKSRKDGFNVAISNHEE